MILGKVNFDKKTSFTMKFLAIFLVLIQLCVLSCFCIESLESVGIIKLFYYLFGGQGITFFESFSFMLVGLSAISIVICSLIFFVRNIREIKTIYNKESKDEIKWFCLEQIFKRHNLEVFYICCVVFLSNFFTGISIGNVMAYTFIVVGVGQIVSKIMINNIKLENRKKLIFISIKTVLIYIAIYSLGYFMQVKTQLSLEFGFDISNIKSMFTTIFGVVYIIFLKPLCHLTILIMFLTIIKKYLECTEYVKAYKLKFEVKLLLIIFLIAFVVELLFSIYSTGGTISTITGEILYEKVKNANVYLLVAIVSLIIPLFFIENKDVKKNNE